MGAVWEPQDYQHVTEITLENMSKIKENSFYSNEIIDRGIFNLTLEILHEQATKVNGAEVLGLYQIINRSIKTFTQGQYNIIHTTEQGALQYILQQPANQLIAMHNHPNDQYFSVGDVGFWVGYPQIMGQMIVTNNCKYQALMKKRYLNNQNNSVQLFNRYRAILNKTELSVHQDADLMLCKLFDINYTSLDYRMIVKQNY